MYLILGFILLVIGLVALVKVRLSFSKKSVAIGPPARIAGAVLVAALPLAFVINLILLVFYLVNVLLSKDFTVIIQGIQHFGINSVGEGIVHGSRRDRCLLYGAHHLINNKRFPLWTCRCSIS